jgi:hypothetical protein
MRRVKRGADGVVRSAPNFSAEPTTPSAPFKVASQHLVAVGMEITLHPPHGSERTDFPYSALA